MPLAKVRLTATKSSLGRHRNLRLARPPGSDSTSTPEDDLRLARPQGSDSTSTSGRRSLPRPTPGLGLNLDLGEATTSLGPTTP
jgi:hypothetical protein